MSVSTRSVRDRRVLRASRFRILLAVRATPTCGSTSTSRRFRRSLSSPEVGTSEPPTRRASQQIYGEIDELERTEIEVENFTQFGEEFPLPLGIGLLFLMAEIGSVTDSVEEAALMFRFNDPLWLWALRFCPCSSVSW